VRVGTPLGEYPLEVRRVERRGDSIAVVGIAAGLEWSLIVDLGDLRRLSTRLALPVGGGLLIALLLRRR
jgi:hypothetical protein